MPKAKRISAILISLCITSNLYADTLSDALTDYKLGSYQSMIEKLEKYQPKGDKLGTKYYLMGVAYNRLQDFEKSVQAFAQAVRLKNDSPDLWYELGQALYANSDLRKAQQAF